MSAYCRHDVIDKVQVGSLAFELAKENVQDYKIHTGLYCRCIGGTPCYLELCNFVLDEHTSLA